MNNLPNQMYQKLQQTNELNDWNERKYRLENEGVGTGRVKISNMNKPVEPYPFFEQVNPKSSDDYENSLKYIQTDTLLSKAFFSNTNLEMIQNMLRYNVWLASDKKYMIDKQDSVQLNIIMRSIYLQYSKNLQYDIKTQIKKLNGFVIDWCVPRVLSEVMQYVQYKKDISRPIEIIPYGEYKSSAGTKTLTLNMFL